MIDVINADRITCQTWSLCVPSPINIASVMHVSGALALDWTIPIYHLHVAFYEVRVYYVCDFYMVRCSANRCSANLLIVLFLWLLDIIPWIYVGVFVWNWLILRYRSVNVQVAAMSRSVQPAGIWNHIRETMPMSHARGSKRIPSGAETERLAL